MAPINISKVKKSDKKTNLKIRYFMCPAFAICAWVWQKSWRDILDFWLSIKGNKAMVLYFVKIIWWKKKCPLKLLLSTKLSRYFSKICLDLATIFQGFSQFFRMKNIIRKFPLISPEVTKQGHKKSTPEEQILNWNQFHNWSNFLLYIHTFPCSVLSALCIIETPLPALFLPHIALQGGEKARFALASKVSSLVQQP